MVFCMRSNKTCGCQDTSGVHRRWYRDSGKKRWWEKAWAVCSLMIAKWEFIWTEGETHQGLVCGTPHFRTCLELELKLFTENITGQTNRSVVFIAFLFNWIVINWSNDTSIENLANKVDNFRLSNYIGRIKQELTVSNLSDIPYPSGPCS